MNNKRPSKSVASAIDPKTDGVIYAIPRPNETQSDCILRVLIRGHHVSPDKVRRF